MSLAMSLNDLLAQTLTNLIANAIKYSPVKTEITVEAQVIDEALLIKVADQGYGIPADALPHVFEPFFTRKARGIGLGLAVTKRIVDSHGGSITVDSTTGAGSTFTVDLPASAGGPVA